LDETEKALRAIVDCWDAYAEKTKGESNSHEELCDWLRNEMFPNMHNGRKVLNRLKVNADLAYYRAVTEDEPA